MKTDQNNKLENPKFNLFNSLNMLNGFCVFIIIRKSDITTDNTKINN